MKTTYFLGVANVFGIQKLRRYHIPRVNVSHQPPWGGRELKKKEASTVKDVTIPALKIYRR
jgi:hypothetical protein